MHDYSPAGILIAPCPDFLAIAELRTMIMDSSSRIVAKTVHDHEKISQSGLQDYALSPHIPSSAHAAKSARSIQRLGESPWCPISPAMASGSHEYRRQAAIRWTCPSLLFSRASRLTWSDGAAMPLSRVTASARRHAGPA